MSPDGDDPIFIGINGLIAKGLNNGEQEKDLIQYPCQVVNRFQCPYEKSNIKEVNEEGSTKSNINVDDLFRLQSMAFLVEIALAVARKEDSKIQIRDKQDLLYALTDNDKILQQADDSHNSPKYRGIDAGKYDNPIADYFMRLKNCLNLDELRFY